MGKKYSKEFKLEALALAEQVGGTQAARSLGIPSNLLYRGEPVFVGQGQRNLCSGAQMLRQSTYYCQFEATGLPRGPKPYSAAHA